MSVDNVMKVPLAEDFLRSSVVTGVERGAAHSLSAVREWLEDQRRSASMRVRRIPFADLGAWRFGKGAPLRLEHASGRFFTVEGARFRASSNGEEWEQPILNQPEVGLLGFLSATINGVLHFLVQAKWEPGNREMQLSPTVQATHSNYTRVHGGRVQPYIEHFASPHKEHVLFDALMPEHGRFFLRKLNRNVVVRVEPDLELLANFRWMTLGQLKLLLRSDDVVHMDTRSVIACLPLADVGVQHRTRDVGGVAEAIVRSAEKSTKIDDEDRWLAGDTVSIEKRGLDQLFGWTMDPDAIRPTSSEHGHFSIIAVHVEAGSREVAEWAQPMIELPHAGFGGLLCAVHDGTMDFLVECRAEPGYGGAAQLFPTVSSDQSGDARLREQFRRAPEARIRFTAQNAEEGGRFFGCENRFTIVELERDSRIQVPLAYRWLSLGQLCRLGRDGRVSMELRNLLACVPVVGAAGAG